MDDQRTSYGAKGKHSSVQKDSYLDSNRLSCEKKTGPLHLALVGLTAGRQAGRQAGRRNMAGFRNLENPLQGKLFGFYFVYSSAMLLVVFEVHFSLLFSNKAHFRVCFVVCKIR